MSQERKRGRPIGSGREASFDHYKPKRWQPEFDWIVYDSISGIDNVDLGIKYGYTPQHISNILNTEHAKEIKDRIRNKSNEIFEGGIRDRLANVGARVVEHLETFIEREDLLQSNPFSFVDRALKIGQVVGTLLPDTSKGSTVTNNTIVQGNAVLAQGEPARDLMNALNKSMELDKVGVGDKVEDRLGEQKPLQLVSGVK